MENEGDTGLQLPERANHLEESGGSVAQRGAVGSISKLEDEVEGGCRSGARGDDHEASGGANDEQGAGDDVGCMASQLQGGSSADGEWWYGSMDVR